MATLYELTEDYMNLLELAEDPDIDEQALRDTMDGIEGAIEDKADGYARVMKQLEATSANLEYEEKRLMNRRKTIDRNIKRMKTALQDAMTVTGKTKFKTDLFSFHIQKNPASVVIDNETSVPVEYLIPQDPKIDKKAIAAMLKEVGEPCPWAHLEQTESLRIR